MLNTNFKVRMAFYFIGIIVLTFGIALTIKANLGASPMDALLVGLHNSFGLTVGSWEYIIAFIMLFLNSLVIGKRPQLLSMSTAILVGIGIDSWLKIFSLTSIFGTFYLDLFFLLIGIALCAIGISTYLQADFLPAPFDETMLVISQKFNVSLFMGKTILMSFFLILAIFFKGPIALGTILSLLASGPIIGWFFPRLKSFKERRLEALL